MASTGIRDLKDNLSHYVRRSEKGERISITAHGRIVAELGPPSSSNEGTRYDALVAAGVVRPRIESGGLVVSWPEIKLAAGTVTELIDADRDA